MMNNASLPAFFCSISVKQKHSNNSLDLEMLSGINAANIRILTEMAMFRTLFI